MKLIVATMLASAAALTLTAASPGAHAQTPPAAAASSYTPVSGQPGKDVVWVPTPDAIVDRMLVMAQVKATDRVVDLGSGDGKIAIAAVRNHGATATGLEFNPQMVELSNRRARDAGVAAKVSFQQADIFETDFSRATVVTMYLLPQLNLKLRPKLFTMPPGTRVVSHSFDMADWVPDEVARVGGSNVYLWRIPANASGTWKLSAPQLTGAPQSLRLRQQFQVLSGDAQIGDMAAGVVRPHLSGDSLNFWARDAAGTLLHFTGKVAGNRITGTVAPEGGKPVPFQAQRDGEPEPITGQAGDDTAPRRG